MNHKEKYTKLIKSTAQKLGFSFCGISQATFLEEEAPKLQHWLDHNYHGKMQYMENYFDIRLNPKLLVDNAKSVVTLMYNYYTEDRQNHSDYLVSKYAFNEDYHTIIKQKLQQFISILKTEIGEINGRGFTDSAPILERVWAKKSGLGWIGKNSLLINKQQGSFFFLAEIILDIALEYDIALDKDYCGTCTACIDACPTDAIIQNQIIDANKCISYLTIELKEEIIPNAFKHKMENYIFGCDICQDVCPWNRFSLPHQEEKFKANAKFLQMKREDWEELSEDIFNTLFKNSAIKRTKYEGLKRNINFVRDAN